jgi:membrane-associated protease RseP (regulator of RpoE activity)
MRTPTVALALVLGLGAPGTLLAQGSPGGARAWIGVGLSERTSCSDGHGGPARDAAGCRTAYVAETVVVGGPADQGGIEPGDTLVAVDGRELGTPAGEEALKAFRAGRSVRIVVARKGGRRTLRITPGRRPSNPEVVQVRVATTGADAPDVLRVRLAVGAPEAARSAEVAPLPPVVRSGTPGQPEPPRSYVLSLPPNGARAGSATVFRFDMGDFPTAWKGQTGFLVDSLSPGLLALRDSVLAEARARLDSLRTVYRSQLRAALVSAETFESGNGTWRLAGAEFRPLGPELAEYFRGADRGLLVLRVLPGTPAGSIGLRPGDVVVRAAGEPVRSASDLRSALVRIDPSDSVEVVWVRKGKAMRGVLRRP